MMLIAHSYKGHKRTNTDGFSRIYLRLVEAKKPIYFRAIMRLRSK